jgi:hypothetical protein
MRLVEGISPISLAMVVIAAAVLQFSGLNLK